MENRVFDVLKEACSVTFFGYSWGSDDATWHGVETRRLYAGRRAALHLCRTGSIDVSDVHGRLAVHAPDACFVPAGVVHVVSGNSAANYLCVEIDIPAVRAVASSGMLGEFAACLSGPHKPAIVRELYNRDMRLLSRRLAYGLAKGDERHTFSLLGMVIDLLSELDRALGTVRKGSLDADTVLAYMEDHVATVSLRDVAEHFCCHPNSIARLLKRTRGTTFSEAMKTLRMGVACSLLEDGCVSVQQVAAVCGYKNMTHFYKVFRSYCGMTPGRFRERSTRRAS